MRLPIFKFFWLASLLISTLSLSSCGFLKKLNQKERLVQLPIPGGIQVAMHTLGGRDSYNRSVQISDHWQLSSVGRYHGWVRKLEPEEQRRLVKTLQNFERLEFTIQDQTGDEIGYTIVAKGSGFGKASEEDAQALSHFLDKLLSVNVAYR